MAIKKKALQKQLEKRTEIAYYERSLGSHCFNLMTSGSDPEDAVARKSILCLLLNDQFVIRSDFVNKMNPSTGDRSSSEFNVSQGICIL